VSDNSKIEWTDASWNPIRARDRATGKLGRFCAHVSPGCANCYAEPINRRLGTGVDYKPGLRDRLEIFLDEAALAKPLAWRRPRKIFVCSMSDLFGAFVDDATIDRVFAVMALCPQHVFQVLTKRPERMRAYLSETEDREREFAIGREINATAKRLHPHDEMKAYWLDFYAYGGCKPLLPLPNVWLGVSVEDQARADERIPVLLDTPAAIRWISAEPLLGPVDLRRWLMIDWQCGYCRRFYHGAYMSRCPDCCRDHGWSGSHPFNGRHNGRHRDRGSGLDWVVVGGESGPRARPMHPDWARSLRDQCAAADVPFLFKQWGEWVSVSEVEGRGPHHRFPEGATVRRVGKKSAGRTLDGVLHDDFPAWEARP
jgi:protein gp37